MILDGVDVTTKPPLRHKVHLHRHAREQRKSVVSGYDIAGVQMLLIYDYGAGEELLAGKVKLDEVEQLEPFEFLARVIPFTVIPIEIIPELERQVRGEGGGFPQLVYTANLFGVLAVRAAMDILAGRPTRKRVVVDANAVLRPALTAARDRGQAASVAAAPEQAGEGAAQGHRRRPRARALAS